jgi:hypothetical protein
VLLVFEDLTLVMNGLGIGNVDGFIQAEILSISPVKLGYKPCILWS